MGEVDVMLTLVFFFGKVLRWIRERSRSSDLGDGFFGWYAAAGG